MKVSICIPNFNYERFLGRTLQSALAQDGVELEVVIADNASTDRSVEVVRSFGDPRVRVHVNATNVGFSGNLDRAGRMASGERMIMLSSDDLVRPGALALYAKLDADLPHSALISSTMDQIDPEDRVTGALAVDRELWLEEDRDPRLSGLVGHSVYRVAAPTLLKRALSTMKNPFNFAATWYRRDDYLSIEGYGGGRMINPDKWFHWRMLGVVHEAVWVDAPLFGYRWHPANQSAQQATQGSLKYLVDQYANVLETTPELLARAQMTRGELEQAFVERDIVRHGLATAGRGDSKRAARILAFGEATYPGLLRGRPDAIALRALTWSGGLGSAVAQRAYRRMRPARA